MGKGDRKMEMEDRRQETKRKEIKRKNEKLDIRNERRKKD